MYELKYQLKYHYPAYFYFIALIAMVWMVYNLRRLLTIRVGKAEKFRQLNIIHQIWNSITFGIAQRGVFSKRFSYAAVMHFLIGWGFIELLFATTVDFLTAWGILVNFLPNLDTGWFAFLNDLGGMMIFVGILMALFRRHINKPEPLPQDSFKGRLNLFGDTGILLFILILVVGGFFAEAARIGNHQPETACYSWIGYPLSKMAAPETWKAWEVPLWWLHAIPSLLFIALLPLTKMFHVIAGIVNVTLTDRKNHSRIRPMHVAELMEDPEVDIENVALGVSKVEDFTWKQLLDSVSCTECSRCTEVCPAYKSQKPLSPMKTITDIRHNLYAEKLNIGEKKELIGSTINETELWSCTTCGACMEECPVLIEHVPTIVDMRRFLILSEGKPPEQASDTLEKTMQNGNPWGFPKNDRLKWAKDAKLEVPVFAQKKEADVLFWVGCAGAYDPLNQPISVAMIKIMETAGIDYAVLGTEESCTGDSARRLGEEYLYETVAAQNIEILNKYKFKTIVTACPHCFHTLKNEYPDFDGNYEVKHHSEFITELIDSRKLKLKKSLKGNITYHDACYLGRHNQIYDQPRNIIKSMMTDSGNFTEIPKNHNDSFCCGAGGGNMWHDIEDGQRINVMRFQEAADSGVETIATACSFCLIMLDDAMRFKGKEDSMKITDIAELVAEKIDNG